MPEEELSHTTGGSNAPGSSATGSNAPQKREAIDDDQLKQMMRDERPGIVERSMPWAVTLILIVINVVVYIVEFLRSGNSPDISIEVLVSMGAMYAPLIDSPADLYRLVMPMFLHMDLLHLLFNMVALYSVGVTLERVLGHANFLLLYLIAGITGNAVSYMSVIITGGNTVSAGASTSLFGLFAAVVLLGLLVRGDRRAFSSYSRSMIGVIVVNIIYTLVAPGISISGHLGGAVGGLIAMFMIPSSRLRVSNVVRIVVTVLWVAALVYIFAFQGVFGS